MRPYAHVWIDVLTLTGLDVDSYAIQAPIGSTHNQDNVTVDTMHAVKRTPY